MYKPMLCALAGALISSQSLAASNHEHHQHHNHESQLFSAPIGVMGDHTHPKGEWMFSYRYGQMDMKGSRDGTNSVTPGEVLANFMVTPLEMKMQMHMFSAMVGLTDDLTLMAMAPYTEKSMRHITRMGAQFSTHTQGWGDIKLSGTYALYQSAEDAVMLNAGLSIPTGSVDERGTTPMGYQKLPYPMQLGSGTVDPKLGLTYTKHLGEWSFGTQADATLRFGENAEDYRLGNEYHTTAWAAKPLADWISVSVRLDGNHWRDVSGRDTQLNPAMVPTARTDLRGGTRLDALLGVSLTQPGESLLKGHRLALELGAPIYQDLNGPQLETDYRLTIGWQKAF